MLPLLSLPLPLPQEFGSKGQLVSIFYAKGLSSLYQLHFLEGMSKNCSGYILRISSEDISKKFGLEF